MSYKLESGVIKSLAKLLKTEINYDVIICIGIEPNFKEFHAHSLILSCRSEYFDKMLSAAENITKKDGKYVINEPNISPQAFDIIIRYLYTGHINVDCKTGPQLLDIMIASDKLKLKELAKHTEYFIIESHHQFVRTNSVEILQAVYYHSSLANIQEFCLKTICFEPRTLFNSNKLINLPAPLLEIILKRDDLNFSAIEIWENLIKWGFAQEEGLDEDVSKWDHETLNHFQRIIYKFIPLIKFQEISPENYNKKIKPYEEILSQKLRDDILKFHKNFDYNKVKLNNIINESRKSNDNIYDSSLVRSQHFAKFSSWIEKDKSNCKSTYDFILLYRASRDGNTASAFHSKCDHKGATIVVVKIKNSDQLVGGYNPLIWDSDNTYKSTVDSFIFSFTNIDNPQTAKVGYSNGGQYSVGYLSFYGPAFGSGDSSSLCFGNGTWHGNNNNGIMYSSYPNIGIPSNFNADDYEVFQVLRRPTKRNVNNNQIETDFRNFVSEEAVDNKGKVRKKSLSLKSIFSIKREGRNNSLSNISNKSHQ